MSQKRKDTRLKGGRDPPDVTLDHVAKDLLEYFKGFKGLQDAEKRVKKKYEITQNTTHWETDDIKRAWGKTTRMYKYSARRKTWSLAIILQVIQLFLLKGSNSEEEGQDTALHQPNQELLPTKRKAKLYESDTKKRSLASDQNCPGDDTTQEMQQNTNMEVSNIRINERSNAGSESQKSTPEIQQSMNKDNTINEQGGTRLRSGKSTGITETRYIRIPLSVMDVTQGPTTSHQTDQSRQEKYKLTDGVPSPIQPIKKTSYVVQYNNHTRNAAWVFEILNKNTLGKKKECDRTQKNDSEKPTRGKTDFFKDLEIHEFFRACDSNEKIPKANYQRGHLAAAANHKWNQQAIDDTFFLSNMSPQVKELNKGPWAALEKHCRDYITSGKCRNVYVYTGPLYRPCGVKDEIKYKVIGDKAVPTHFFKVVILENAEDGKLDVECHILPNDKHHIYQDINQYKKILHDTKTKDLDISDIEKFSGILFTEKSDNVSNKEEEVIVHWKAKDENQQKQSLNIEMTILPSKNSQEQVIESVEKEIP